MQLPRGIRNNNPGNIVRTADRWIGMSVDQSADSRFVVFEMPEDGIRALMRLLINYQERNNLNSIRTIINKWAPPLGRDENNVTYTQNTSGYVQHVARMTGFDPDEVLDLQNKETCLKMTKAIIRHENGDPTKHGNKNPFWYPEDVYDRAAVRAGFNPVSQNPLRNSRTVAAVITGAAGAIVANTNEVISDITTVATAGGWSENLVNILGQAITIISLIVILYARWDDAKRKLR